MGTIACELTDGGGLQRRRCCCCCCCSSFEGNVDRPRSIGVVGGRLMMAAAAAAAVAARLSKVESYEG